MIMNAFKKDTTFVKIQHLKGRCHQAKLRKLKNFAKLTKQKWIFLVTYYASTILGGVADAWGQKFYKYTWKNVVVQFLRFWFWHFEYF